MPKFKVVNPDAPEEIDFYQDIPLVDPDTGADQLDSDGNILVKRYVNHTVSIKGINEVKDALPAIKTNTQNLEELYQYSHAQNEAQQIAINNNASAIVDLQTSTSEMALDLETLTNKINGIQGIDIDELKDYVYAQVPLIKNSYLPLVGGTITGNVTVEEGTITGSLTGVASNATADVNNKDLTSYVADIMGANAQLSIIKGDGTTSVLSINNVLKAINADNLGGYPASDYVRSVNGVNADAEGNVELYDYVIESDVNDNGDWYRKYKSGWLEQGGIMTLRRAGDAPTPMPNVRVNFLKPYLNNKYTVTTCVRSSVASESDGTNPTRNVVNIISGSINRANTTGFYINRLGSDTDRDFGPLIWHACGMGA